VDGDSVVVAAASNMDIASAAFNSTCDMTISDRMSTFPKWYLIKTKFAKERWVHDQLRHELAEVFLPLLKTSHRRVTSYRITALFPCYLFARIDLGLHYFKVKYTAGVRGLVSAGMDPLAVPEEIVSAIKERGINGVVEIKPKTFQPGERIRVAKGPFRDFEAIFERYLSGLERVAVLVRTVEAKGIRMVLPAEFISPDR
jgi:transcriptional antiterminator RfaH